jgi:tripartite-type tricarboxylate transporter receptor subunit TctC
MLSYVPPYLPRAIAIVALASAIAASAARADDYPSRPVKIIAPFGAGGPTDLYTRDIADELRKALHQTFYIENRPGAGTTIGTDMVAKADPDGYTLLMVSGTQTVNETLYANKPYHLLQDLVPIAPLIETDLRPRTSPSFWLWRAPSRAH